MLWLAIFVPALPLQVFTRAQLDAELPMAVLDARASARILLANDAACAQGVHADQAVAAAQAAALTWMRRVSCLMPTNKWWMRFGLDNCSQKTVAYNTQATTARVLAMAMTK